VKDSRLESPRGDPIIPGIDGCIQRLQREDDQILDDGPIEDVQKTISFKQGFLDKKVVQLEDGRESKRR